MNIINILLRNIKWRFQNPISILLTIIQPLLWLILYSTIAGQFMKETMDVNYVSFILPGIMVLVTFSCCSSGGYINFIMKSKGSFQRILISPVRRSDIVLGQIFEAVSLSIFEAFILVLISLFFSVRIESGILGILLLIVPIFFSAFFMAGISYTISLKLPNEVIYETVMSLVILFLFFMSTALFPTENVSVFFRVLLTLNPFVYSINFLRSLILENTINWNSFFIMTIIFSVLCIIIFFVSVKTLEKQTDS